MSFLSSPNNPGSQTPNVVQVTLLNGWTAATGYGAFVYQDANGLVHFGGQVINGTYNTMFTLPSGWAPGSVLYLPVLLAGGALIGSPARVPFITIDTSGNVLAAVATTMHVLASISPFLPRQAG